MDPEEREQGGGGGQRQHQVLGGLAFISLNKSSWREIDLPRGGSVPTDGVTAAAMGELALQQLYTQSRRFQVLFLHVTGVSADTCNSWA